MVEGAPASGPAAWRDWRLLVAAAWVVVAAVVQASWYTAVPLGFVWAAVLISATFAPVRAVGALAGLALVMTTVGGVVDHSYDDGGFWVRQVIWLVVAGIAAAMAHQRAKLDARMAELATTDELTGLANRRLLVQRLSAQLEVRGRTEAAAVVMLDLDRFKAVNDSKGHGAGDDVLTAVANRLLAMVRTEDTVARFGGDEFVIGCPSIDGRPGLDVLCERIGEVLSAPVTTRRGTVAVGATIGAVLLPPREHVDVETLVAAADDVLIARKATAPGGYEIVEARGR